jgi:hypothetical protein
MRRNLIAFLISFTAPLIVGYIVISINIDQSVPGATEIELIGRCNLIYFDTRLQPVNTLVFGCPRMDMFCCGPFLYNTPGLRIHGTITLMNLTDKIKY